MNELENMGIKILKHLESHYPAGNVRINPFLISLNKEIMEIKKCLHNMNQIGYIECSQDLNWLNGSYGDRRYVDLNNSNIYASLTPNGFDYLHKVQQVEKERHEGMLFSSLGREWISFKELCNKLGIEYNQNLYDLIRKNPSVEGHDKSQFGDGDFYVRLKQNNEAGTNFIFQGTTTIGNLAQSSSLRNLESNIKINSPTINPPKTERRSLYSTAMLIWIAIVGTVVGGCILWIITGE